MFIWRYSDVYLIKISQDLTLKQQLKLDACTITLKDSRLFFYLSHTRLYREYITSSEMYSLHLTHPKWTHTRSSGQLLLQRPGSSWGFGVLLKDTSVVVLKEERELVIHSPTNNPCRTGDSNPQPLDYKSDSLTIRPRLPHKRLFLKELLLDKISKLSLRWQKTCSRLSMKQV